MTDPISDFLTHLRNASKAGLAQCVSPHSKLKESLAGILKAEGYAFSLFTPLGSVRLMSDRSTEDFIELSLDVSGEVPQVIGHASRSRGRRVIEEERAIGSPSTLTEEALLDFLAKELEAFVER